MFLSKPSRLLSTCSDAVETLLCMTGAMTAASLMGAEKMYSPELAPFIMETAHEFFEVAIVFAVP
jgi:hypothetical protein